jgi:hypothetical protein
MVADFFAVSDCLRIPQFDLKRRFMSLRTRNLSFFSAVAALALAASPVPGLPQAAAPAAANTPVIVAKFTKLVSTKNLKTGDVIDAKTLKPVKLTDGTEIPKGSTLIAKVSVVKSKAENNGNSVLAFRIDNAELKGGQLVPIHGMVVAIGPSLAPKSGLGAGSVMGRGGYGSGDPSGGGGGGLDPNAGLGKAGAMDETNIPIGSTLEGVALGTHKDADWTTPLEGFKRDIQLDDDVLIKVQLK